MHSFLAVIETITLSTPYCVISLGLQITPPAKYLFCEVILKIVEVLRSGAYLSVCEQPQRKQDTKIIHKAKFY